LFKWNATRRKFQNIVPNPCTIEVWIPCTSNSNSLLCSGFPATNLYEILTPVINTTRLTLLDLTTFCIDMYKVRFSLYRPGVAQRVCRGIALLFHDRGTRRGWGGGWSAVRPGHTFPPGKDPVSILHEAGWAPGPVWTDGKSRLHRD